MHGCVSLYPNPVVQSLLKDVQTIQSAAKHMVSGA